MTHHFRCHTWAATTVVEQPSSASVSIITATAPRRLSKGFFLNPEGALEKTPGGQLAEGRLEVCEVTSLSAFAELLAGLTPAQALCYGVPRNVNAVTVVTRKAFEAAAPSWGHTARTNEAFAWPVGPGIMMLDYDPEPGVDPLAREELVATIRKAVPALESRQMLWWTSASSGIYHGELQLRGISGQRLWLMLADATDIPRAGKVLSDRLWLAGRGYIRITASGGMLTRTLVDTMVWQPSRLDFAGGAACEAPLSQRRGRPVLIDGVEGAFDSRRLFCDLSPEEAARVVELKERARDRHHPEAMRRRATWKEARLAEVAGAGDCQEAGVAADDALEDVLETGSLPGWYIVHVMMEDGVAPVTVSQILAERERYHGRLCLDPVEPDYDGRRPVGKIYSNGRHPNIFSFARGGATYRLSRSRARIELEPGRTSDVVSAVIRLLSADPVAFDYGDHLALVEDGQMHALNEDALQYHLGLNIACFKEGRKGEVECDLPAPVTRQILALGRRRGLRTLDGVVTGPTIRMDGSILNCAGYDPETRLYVGLSSDTPEIADRPTEEDARGALQSLMRPFRAFPFVDTAARGAHLAALLTAAVRPVLGTAPAIAYDAPMPGSGKTLLASCVAALAEGRRPDVWPHAASEEEVRKRILAALLSGSRALIWDNVTGAFDSASMAALLTGSGFIDRVLGKSEARRVPNKIFVTLTGNNLAMAGDLTRRVLVCRINPETEEPYAREFDFDPMELCLEQRVSLLASACTLIRARIVNQPRALGRGKLASFEDWDHLVRQTVVWADRILEPGGYGDPMDLFHAARAYDPATEARSVLLDALGDLFGEGEFSAREVADRKCEAIERVVADLGGDRALTSSRSLGHVLRRCTDQPTGGRRLTSRMGPAKSLLYRVRFD